ncbi:MAG: hypothetical protein K2O73_09630 [Lachnospiraceae bacterium]|nr:hypothetical protein [Lachnospiraceae bacterium]MDE7436643.1 hypothetical protein [Lachnospiraceae bacterium]
MKKKLKKTIITGALLALVLAASMFTGCKKQASVSMEELYEMAVRDAVFADEDEILPLVTIDKDSDMVTWNEAGDKVLLLVWHKYPDSYPDGEDVEIQWGEVWTFTEKELVSWYKANEDDITDMTLRLEQLIGLPEGKGNTYFTAFWVDPADIVRPAYVTDITAQMTNVSSFDEPSNEFEEWYADWFDGNILWSYFDSAYPWTRLGYTYDWADNGQEYGLSEFIVLPDSNVTVEFTMTNEAFFEWLKEHAA